MAGRSVTAFTRVPVKAVTQLGRGPKDRQQIVDERFGSPRRRQAALTRRALPDFAEPYPSRIRIAGNKAASSRSLTSVAGCLRLPLPKTRGIERAPRDHSPAGDRREKRLFRHF